MSTPLVTSATPTYEVVHAAGTRRDFADTFPGLLEHLVPGYSTLDAHGQWVARLHLAALAQVQVQAVYNAAADMSGCSILARAVLASARDDQPNLPVWDEPVPLVLLATAYAPAGPIPVPSVPDGSAGLVWIDPSDEESLLRTLHHTGFVDVNIRDEGDTDALP